MTLQDLVDARRPRRADARRNYDALVAAARAAFAEAGAGAPLDDIARRAEVGIGTLYRNFPTRDDLIEAVYVDEIASLVDAAEAASSLEPFDALAAWLDRFVLYVGTKRALLEGLNRDKAVFLQCREVMYEAGAPLLARAQQAGAVRDDVAIADVVKLVSGVAAVAVDDDAQQRRLIDLAVDGLRAR